MQMHILVAANYKEVSNKKNCLKKLLTNKYASQTPEYKMKVDATFTHPNKIKVLKPSWNIT